MQIKKKWYQETCLIFLFVIGMLKKENWMIQIDWKKEKKIGNNVETLGVNCFCSRKKYEGNVERNCSREW